MIERRHPKGNVALPMPDVITPLILDLLEWIAVKPRTYAEVMDAWRTSCPRLTVWEEANDRGLVVRKAVPEEESVVELTPLGSSFLAAKRPRAN
jgi:hypothetical protein